MSAARQGGIALAALLGAVALRGLMDVTIGAEAVYLPFGMAVLVAAWLGGPMAGGAASLLAALAAATWLREPGAGTDSRIAWFVIFLVAGLAATALIRSLRAGWDRAEARAAEAEAARQRLLHEQQRSSESRMRAEHALREREARFRLLVESMVDHALFMLAPDGRVMTWSAGAERLTGYTGEEIIGRHVSVFHPTADQRAGKPAGVLRAALRDGRHEEDGWRVRKDGTQIRVNAVVTPIQQGGELVGFAQVQRELARSHSSNVLLESVLDSAIDGIIGVDEHGIIRSFNAAAERMFRHDARAVTGLRFSVLLAEPDRASGAEFLSRHARGDPRMTEAGRQFMGLRSDGTTFPLALAVSEVTLDGRRYFTSVVRDLTRQQALEEQLQQVQQMHAIGQLAGSVAHDFNNLLTIIAGHTELLLNRYQEPGDLHHALSDIRDAGMRAAGLTQQLLAFSRRAVLAPKVLDINTVVQETQRTLRRIVPEDVEMVTRLEPELRPVSVDHHQIGQVLINLIVNARDALPHGGRIEISTSNCDLEAGPDLHPDAEPGCGIMLAVRDDGEGMTPDVVKHVFEPFFTTKDTGTGTGLGLAMVYGIVRQSGGHVEVSSEPGAGSEFRVFLPAAASARAQTVPPPSNEGSLAGEETLLVVEDEDSVRRLAVLALREHGYRVIEAGNGVEALRTLASYEGDIDLVVTDVVMPVMGGRQLVEELKPLRPDAAVLYVSGYTDDAVIRHGVQRADVAFLQKPYTPQDLARKVRRVLDRRA